MAEFITAWRAAVLVSYAVILEDACIAVAAAHLRVSG